MNILIYLMPAALLLSSLGLGAFLWSLRSGQYDDLEGAAERILLDDDELPPDLPDDLEATDDKASSDPRTPALRPGRFRSR